MGWLALSFLFGVLVGSGELLSRYKDAPKDLIKFPAAWLYMAVNGCASAIAYGVIVGFGWQFGRQETDATTRFLMVVAAGTSAMAILRSSFAKIRYQGVDINVGAQAFLDAYLATSDRAVDRSRAKQRDAEVTEIMADLDFGRTAACLPPYCFQLLQNSAPEEEAAIGASVLALIRDEDIEESVKARMLGLQLMVAVGPDVLRQAVTSLRPVLQQDEPSSALSSTAAAVLARLMSAPGQSEFESFNFRLGDPKKQSGDGD